MPFYMFEVRDTDGNDCDVLDAIVKAETREQASDRLWKHLDAAYPNDEHDGGFGTFHSCDCQCEHGVSPWQCEESCGESWECSHGGLLTNEDLDGKYGPQEFATEDGARAAHVYYHSLIDLTDDETASTESQA